MSYFLSINIFTLFKTNFLFQYILIRYAPKNETSMSSRAILKIKNALCMVEPGLTARYNLPLRGNAKPPYNIQDHFYDSSCVQHQIPILFRRLIFIYKLIKNLNKVTRTLLWYFFMNLKSSLQKHCNGEQRLDIDIEVSRM